MSAIEKLHKAQQKNRSMICVGLDLDSKRMPNEYSNSIKGYFDFAKKIIDATSDLVCAYKPNLAFFEHHGAEGISLLKLIVDRIPEHIPVILDAKRGDIGNTAEHYAHALQEHLGADWVTLSPYMGYDSIKPFVESEEKGAFVLCLTSNESSSDFQQLQIGNDKLYEIVAKKVAGWNQKENLGLVVGATHPEQLAGLRQIAPGVPFLIPGVGAQGGSLERAAVDGSEAFTQPALINVSRSVLYASRDDSFAEKAHNEVRRLNSEIQKLRDKTRDGQQEEQRDESNQAVVVEEQTSQSEQPQGGQNHEQPQEQSQQDRQQPDQQQEPQQTEQQSGQQPERPQPEQPQSSEDHPAQDNEPPQH